MNRPALDSTSDSSDPVARFSTPGSKGVDRLLHIENAVLPNGVPHILQGRLKPLTRLLNGRFDLQGSVQGVIGRVVRESAHHDDGGEDFMQCGVEVICHLILHGGGHGDHSPVLPAAFPSLKKAKPLMDF